MATALITWVPTSGSNYEIWYSKLSVVGSTSLPPSSGWTQASGSPFASTLGTASITGLDDNTLYRIATRNDCSSLDSAWSSSTKYKLDCPTFSLVANPVSVSDVGASITATINLTNLVEFEAIVSSITLTVTKTSDSSVASTKVFSSPFDSATLTNTFSGLLVTTSYTVTLTMHDNIGNTIVTCDSHNITTQTPVVIPPPVCTAPTFTIGSITTTTFVISITSSTNTGDTFSVSLDGGVTYVTTAPVTTITISGLISGTSYQVVVRRNCVGGGQGISTSQTITTLVPTIIGTISMNATPGSGQQNVFFIFTFPTPTPAPLTLYLGFTLNEKCNSCGGGRCNVSNGYSIFTAPAQTCPSSPSGDIFYNADPSQPFSINIPAGVTTFNSGIHVTSVGAAFPNNNPWVYDVNFPGLGLTDVYVKLQSPTNFTSNFTKATGTNITNDFAIHNV